jgi:hypothetical protein
MDWQFRAASAAAFAADLNALCGAFGYQPLSSDGQTVASCTFQDLLRFDFDTMTLPSGWHVNARATVLPHVDETKASAALTLLDQQIRGFFAGLPTMTNAAPAAPADGSWTPVGGQTYHTTSAGTVLIDPAPLFPQRVWA